MFPSTDAQAILEVVSLASRDANDGHSYRTDNKQLSEFATRMSDVR